MYSGRFAARLRALREKAGMSVEDLVDRTGIPAQTLYSWEQGKYTPPIETFPMLAETFGVEVRTLLPKE